METVTKWLNRKSEFFSKIAEFSVTRREVLLVHGIFFCVMMTMMMCEKHPLLALLPMVFSWPMVCSLNRKK